MADVSDLIEAVRAGDRDKCVSLLESSKSNRDYANERDKAATTALTEAVDVGNLAIIELLI